MGPIAGIKADTIWKGYVKVYAQIRRIEKGTLGTHCRRYTRLGVRLAVSQPFQESFHRPAIPTGNQ